MNRERSWLVLVGAALVVALAVGASVMVHAANGAKKAAGGAQTAAVSAKASADAVGTNVDFLVAFVRQIQNSPPDDQTAAVVAEILALLCATSDPVTIAKCHDYGIATVAGASFPPGDAVVITLDP